MAKAAGDKGSLGSRIDALYKDVASRLKAREQQGLVDADSASIVQILGDLTKLTKITADMHAEMQSVAKNVADIGEIRDRIAKLTRIISDL